MDKQKIKKLNKLGFKENRIIETLLVIDTEPPVCTPIGIWREKNDFYAKIHKETNTNRKLSREKICTANIVNNKKIIKALIEPEQEIKKNQVSEAEATLKLETIERKKEKKWVKYKFKLKEMDIKDPCAKGICRAEQALLESAVHATRTHLNQKHIQMIDHYKETIKKTGSQEEIKLSKKLEKWVKEKKK